MANKKRRTFTKEKKKAILHAAETTSVHAAAKKYKVNAALIYKWRNLDQGNVSVFKSTNGLVMEAVAVLFREGYSVEDCAYAFGITIEVAEDAVRLALTNQEEGR